jgi:hypothetical protein
MPKYKCKIENPSVNGVNGHHSVLIHIIETSDDGKQTTKGIPETYAIDSGIMESKYSGNVHQWLQDISKEMLVKHKSRQLAHMELINMAGMTFDLEDSP